ncbi:MAG: hypothetical protein EZS28_030128 [Streblomastix strix]|uniref:Uncharacterized protein n=1 Tax=Streblomastix strix TaxID=222440 RepID=A0A5J4UX53_9EUKA|nr:MAG: hypothetical protein EZS28_030128 [Streblomastix strix]
MQAAMEKRQTVAVSLCLSFPPIHSQIHVLFQATAESKQANFSHSELNRFLDIVIQRSDHLDQILVDYYVTISGDSQYQVFVWKICRDSQQLVATMKELRMTVTVVHITYDSLECAISRSDGQMLSRKLTHNIRLKQMIKTANFHGMSNQQVKLQLIACGSGLFSICIDVSEGKQLREEQSSDKELFSIAVDSTEMKFALTKIFEKGHQRQTQAIIICQF